MLANKCFMFGNLLFLLIFFFFFLKCSHCLKVVLMNISFFFRVMVTLSVLLSRITRGE